MRRSAPTPRDPIRVRSVLWLLFVIGPLGMCGVGCIQLSDFNPVGGEASIAGAWVIDGEPPTSESCEALGASRVQVSFLDLLRPVPHTGLSFECTEGQFDTTAEDGSGAVVGAGHWDIRLDALDAAGNLVAASQTFSVSVPDTTHIVLIPEGSAAVEYSTGVVSATYQIGGAAPSRALCEELGVATVELAFSSDTGLAGEAREPCAAGTVGTRVTPGLTYEVRLRALAEGGEPIAESAPETFVVGVGERAELNGGAPLDLTAL